MRAPAEPLRSSTLPRYIFQNSKPHRRTRPKDRLVSRIKFPGTGLFHKSSIVLYHGETPMWLALLNPLSSRSRHAGALRKATLAEDELKAVWWTNRSHECASNLHSR